jgi:hypothetical protein
MRTAMVLMSSPQRILSGAAASSNWREAGMRKGDDDNAFSSNVL